MKAAVVRAFGEPLVIEERPDPGQVRIRVEASGLCHTDIHAAHGDWPVKPNPLAVNEAAFAAVYGGLRRGGKLVMVALPAHGTVQVPIFDTVLNGTSVIGSIVGTRQDLAEVFELHAAGRTRVVRESRPLVSVNESIDAVLRGQVKARIVFDFGEDVGEGR